MAICLIICSFLYLARTLDTWRGMTWHVIRVRSKDAQKQLARTSLRDWLVNMQLLTPL